LHLKDTVPFAKTDVIILTETLSRAPAIFLPVCPFVAMTPASSERQKFLLRCALPPHHSCDHHLSSRDAQRNKALALLLLLVAKSNEDE